MATEEAEVAEAAQEAAKKRSSNGGLLKTLGLGFGIFVIVAAAQYVTSIVGCLVTPGLMPGCAAQVSGDEATPDPKAAKAAKTAKKKEEAPKAPPVYLAFDPPLVVSFQEEATMRFLQATVEVMARDEESLALVKTHMPVIRNNLLNVLSGKNVAALTSREGKEELRKECLAEVQRVLKANAGKDAKSSVEDLYFTSFVVQ